jgi:hypothetical protein
VMKDPGDYTRELNGCYREERPIPGIAGGSVVTWYVYGSDEVVGHGVFTRASASLHVRGADLDGEAASRHYRCGLAGDLPGHHALSGRDLEGPDDPDHGGDPVDRPRGGPRPTAPSGGAAAPPGGTSSSGDAAERWVDAERDEPPGPAAIPGWAHDSAHGEPDVSEWTSALDEVTRRPAPEAAWQDLNVPDGRVHDITSPDDLDEFDGPG